MYRRDLCTLHSVLPEVTSCIIILQSKTSKQPVNWHWYNPQFIQIGRYLLLVYHLYFILFRGTLVEQKFLILIRCNLSTFPFYDLVLRFSKAGPHSTCFGIVWSAYYKAHLLRPHPKDSELAGMGPGSLFNLRSSLKSENHWFREIGLGSFFLALPCLWAILFIPTTCIIKYVWLTSVYLLQWTLK